MNHKALNHSAGRFEDIACTRGRVIRVLLASVVLWRGVTLCAQQIAAVEVPREPAAHTVSDGQAPAQSTSSATADSPIHTSIATASISGVVVDPMGDAVAGATVRLTRDDPAGQQNTIVGINGGFVFANLEAGAYRLSISAPGFASSAQTVVISAGQIYTVPQTTLGVASANTDVEVVMSRTEIAQVQMEDEEKQRILAVIPNFYVSYVPNAAPLSSKQKFELAGRLVIDPVSFAITGVTAGIQQSNNSYPSWGQGASGYAKRYAASTGTFLNSVVIGNAILPSLLKQDPRYFYKGTGTVKSRILYAIAMSVIARGDNGKWQPNYSGILGGLAAGGLSNLYYPAANRDGVGLTFRSAAIGTAGSAAGNIIQEFLLRKLTPHTGKNKPSVSGTAQTQP
jgi:hypothetical protein